MKGLASRITHGKTIHISGFLLTILVLVAAPVGEARVTRIQITSREVVAGGISFGDTGPYEKLLGTAYFEVDPNDPRNAVVFDLDKAARDSRGMVELSAGVFILRPVDMTKGNGKLFFEANNRGDKLSFFLLNDALFDINNNNPTTIRDFGDGFLLRQGYALAWVGWEGDILPTNNRLVAQLPIAMEGGKPITERILTEFSDTPGSSATAFTVPLSYETVSTDQAVAMAELRTRPSDSPRPSAPDIPEGEVVPTAHWSFAKCTSGPPGTPSTTDICLAAGFRNNMVYQLTYKATKSLVSGLGYVTTRDFVSFLRNAAEDDAGNPNPVPGISTVLGFGYSQSGQYMRDFLYQGFNEDEGGGRVFDGVHIHAGAIRKLYLNYRFANPKGSRQHVDRYIPDNDFPRTYAVRPDPVTGVMDGILKRPVTDPKVVHSDTSTEYWNARSSLVDTDEQGTLDLDHPANVRRYLLSSTQHAQRRGGVPNYGIGNRQFQQLDNRTPTAGILPALLVALDEWVCNGIDPPDSRVPRIDDGTLVPSDQENTGFPSIPAGPTWNAVTYNGLFNASGDRDFGPRVSGHRGVIDNLIPLVLGEHRVLVPKVDETGNDIAGIRHPVVEAPIATLTGWNLRRPEFTDGDLADLSGMTIPLFRSKEDRLAAGDPRPSLEELYHNHRGYVHKVARAARRLALQRLLLWEDVDRIIQEADASDVLR